MPTTVDTHDSETTDRLPAHLRRFVVEQDYAAYDEIDQAVWRFILLQTYARLRETAHAAYADGLGQTGIGVERIPRIREMDARLSDYGWGAVAVDGFIPPRAFQEFQALGILPIAAEIRRADQLAYTPEPDIIHESVGHAPIIPDSEYSAYLRRIGEVGARAFSSTAADETSESARLTRLHWWTVEYGLVGQVHDYKLYGAGLLSSLGESHFCHDPGVRKLPLSSDCVDVDFDITRPQPQLFVAESFAQLGSVLEEVAAGLAWGLGGAVGLERARASGEVATLVLDSGLELIGLLEGVDADGTDAVYLRLGGPCALGRAGRILEGQGRESHPLGYGTPLGPLEDGAELHRLREAELRARLDADGRLALRYRSGVRLQGRLERVCCAPDGTVLIATLSACRVVRGDSVLFEPEWGAFDLAAGTQVRSAHAGPSDPSYWPESEPSAAAAPRPRHRAGAESSLLDLYREALRLWEQPDHPELVPRFERLHSSLRDRFPEEWLLPWNLLECLRKQDRGPELAAELRAHLLAIEGRHPRDAPIRLGLRYLDEQVLAG